MFDTLLPEKSILPAHPWANMAGRRNKKRFYICSEVIDSITDANSICLGRGLGWFNNNNNNDNRLYFKRVTHLVTN